MSPEQPKPRWWHKLKGWREKARSALSIVKRNSKSPSIEDSLNHSRQLAGAIIETSTVVDDSGPNTIVNIGLGGSVARTGESHSDKRRLASEGPSPKLSKSLYGINAGLLTDLPQRMEGIINLNEPFAGKQNDTDGWAHQLAYELARECASTALWVRIINGQGNSKLSTVLKRLESAKSVNHFGKDRRISVLGHKPLPNGDIIVYIKPNAKQRYEAQASSPRFP